MTEPNIYGHKRVELSMTFRISGVAIAKMKETVGHFRPVPVSDWDDPWETWRASVSQSALAPSGWLDLRWTADTDFIANACPSQALPVIQSPTPNPFQDVQDIIADLIQVPPREASYLHYRNYFRIESDSGAIRSRPLPQKPVVQPAQTDFTEDWSWTQPDPGGDGSLPDPSGGMSFGRFQETASSNDMTVLTGGTLASTVGGTDPSTTPDPACMIQRQSVPTVKIIMFGEALRAAYEVAIPQLTSVDDGAGGKITPVASSEEGASHITKGCVGNFGVPLFGAKWQLTYILETTPKGTIKSPENPMESIDWASEYESISAPDKPTS